MGNMFKKSSSLKPVSQFKANMAWMVLKWSIFRIVSSDPDLHPRWPPSADIQVKNGLDLGENYRNINGCKTFAASIAQTLVDKQVKFQILSYKLGLGKSAAAWRSSSSLA
jgi:hypothetical protein